MNNFSFNSVDNFKIFLKDKKFNKILVICGKKSFKDSGAKKLMESLLKNRKVEFYFKKFFNPNHKELKKIITRIKILLPDLIVAIGGGSVIDYAKIANVLTESKNLENEIVNSTYNAKKKYTKLVAIPTTAGSGAEVTCNAVIYINNIKYSVEGKSLKPDYFFLLPELVIGASNKIKSSAGFDAIAQAIESLISKRSNAKSINFAEKSLRISLKYFLDFLDKPNHENTTAMCLAANFSGEAINISKTTAPHAVSYPFTSIYNVSHGHAVSLTLNKFLLFNYKNIESANCNFDLKKRYQIMFDLSKTSNISEFDRYLINLKNKAKLENSFTKLGINIKEDYENIISGVNILRLSNNPIRLEKKNLKEIIQS